MQWVGSFGFESGGAGISGGMFGLSCYFSCHAWARHWRYGGDRFFKCHSPKRVQQSNRCSLELCNTQVVSVGISMSHSFTTIGITGTAVQGTSAQNHSSPHQYSKGSALCWLLIELILDTKSCRTIGTNLMSRGIQASKCFQCSDCLSARDFPK